MSSKIKISSCKIKTKGRSDIQHRASVQSLMGDIPKPTNPRLSYQFSMRWQIYSMVYCAGGFQGKYFKVLNILYFTVNMNQHILFHGILYRGL